MVLVTVAGMAVAQLQGLGLKTVAERIVVVWILHSLLFDGKNGTEVKWLVFVSTQENMTALVIPQPWTPSLPTLPSKAWVKRKYSSACVTGASRVSVTGVARSRSSTVHIAAMCRCRMSNYLLYCRRT